MAIKRRNHTGQPGFTDEYNQIWAFMHSLGLNNNHSLNLSWVRWEWCRSLSFFDSEHEGLTSIWEDEGEIVGVACYETRPGDGFISLKEGYDYLLDDMFTYAIEHFKKDDKVKIAIPDNSRLLQEVAIKHGFIPTNDRETDSILDVGLTNLDYSLPEGFHIVSLDHTYDLEQYASVMWHGFGHSDEGPVPLGEEDLKKRAYSLAGPHNDLHLKIAVTNPEGDFVSYAGFWYDRRDDYCTLEPCATHPDYRRMGLGKAAIYEGIKRCAERGAKRCMVGSNQDFYFRIGFSPYHMRTYWIKK